MIRFRREIQTEMRRQGLSAYGLAKEAGLPIRGVQRFLAGEREITSRRLAALLQALGFEMSKPRRQKSR